MRWIQHLCEHCLQLAARMNTRDWVLVLAGLLVFGWLCLRGFGSRSSY